MKKLLTEWRKYLNESGFNRIKRILQGKVASVSTVGFLTAENPMAQPLSSRENKLLNKEMMTWLRTRGYGPIRIRGSFGNKERSFMVPNITREDAIEAGKRFEQEAVIWGEKKGEGKFVFEYIEGDKTIQRRDAVLHDEDTQSREDFYSQERQSAGRKFLIPFFDEEYEMTEGQESEYDFPNLTEEQREGHSALLTEINERVEKSLDSTRTGKSRYHHRQILNLKLWELKTGL